MRVLNIGSLNIDYVYEVDHFATKGETISSRSMSRFSGGKGLNQSIALSRAGAHACHAGLVGKEGGFLRELLVESGVDAEFVRTCSHATTGHAIIQRDATGDNCIVLHGGANQEIEEPFVDDVLAAFSPSDWLLLQNETSCNVYAATVAKERGMRVILNPSPVDDVRCPLIADIADCIILNEGEARVLVNADSSGEELAKAVCARYPGSGVVLTVGERGSYYVRADERTLYQEAFRVEPVDTTAAGDTFTGYYLAEISRGSTQAQALQKASAASALAVTVKGAAPAIPYRDDVEEYLTERRSVS